MFEIDHEEDDKKNESRNKVIDAKIDETLLKARRIFFSGSVDMDSAKEAIRKLWYLELTDPGKPILLVINSPGGVITAGFAVWDQIQMITSPVTTLITGLAASMGSVLSLCARPGKRFATPYSRIMIHQPSIMGVVKGQATDLAIQATEIKRTHQALVDLYVKSTKQDPKIIEKALDRDRWFTASEALDFNLIDGIITSFDEIGF